MDLDETRVLSYLNKLNSKFSYLAVDIRLGHIKGSVCRYDKENTTTCMFHHAY